MLFKGEVLKIPDEYSVWYSGIEGLSLVDQFDLENSSIEAS